MPPLPIVIGLFSWSLIYTSQDTESKYPLDAPLKVLAKDVKDEKYRELVLKKMLITDLAAEWQRVATEDNADTFLEKHGGKDKVLADGELKKAYERRVQIREDFLSLMREGYKRYNQVPPFDKGMKAEIAGTQIKKVDAEKINLSIVLPCTDADKHWPRFRGPSGQGETTQTKLPTTWDKDSKQIVWRTKVPGLGNSSPIIWGDKIFLTTAEDKGKQRFVLCFRTKDGELLWNKAVPSKSPEPAVRDKNGFASATPVTDGERVISFLGSCGLVCHDMAGNQLWIYDQMTFKTTHGTASSPIMYKDLVIFFHDQNQVESIFLALDKRTGKKIWEEKRSRAMTWNSPVILNVNGRDELILAGNRTVKGYDPNTGNELWSLNGPTEEVVPTIVAGQNLIYSASGRNGPTLAIRPGGKGDVSQSHLAWRVVRGGPHVPSPILVKDRLYTVNDTGIVTCLNANNGQMIFQERISDRFSASPIYAGNILYLPAESGITYLIKASDQLEVIGQNDLGSPILASPAVVGNDLILRTQEELVCIRDKTP